MLSLWRANLLGSSSKGHEYFLRHILGVPDAAVRGEESAPEQRPDEVEWRDDAPVGKLDLFTTLDFRMNGSCIYSDVVLPAATWYEKQDLSSTDLHPFVHPFNAAIPPPWETKTDWDAFNRIAADFSRLAEKHLGTRTDLVAAPLLHDTPDELAQPMGRVRDWKAGECEPIPGKTMPKLVPVERDFTAVAEKMNALGPLVEKAGIGAKGVSWKPEPEVAELGRRNGRANGGGAADGRPNLVRDVDVCEAILALSGTTNGRLAVESFRALEHQTGLELAHVPEERADDRLTFARDRDPAAQGDRLGRVVGARVARAPLLAVHRERRAADSVANPDRPPAAVRRPRLDARPRRGPARLPAPGRRGSADRARGRAGSRRHGGRRGRRGHGPLPDAALEMVDPLRVPGQPA